MRVSEQLNKILWLIFVMAYIHAYVHAEMIDQPAEGHTCFDKLNGAL